jgi:hypothetical protein
MPINNNKHHVNPLYVHEKYGTEKSREPMTLATTVDEFVHRWYWDEEGVCKSAEPSRDQGKSPTIAAQCMVNARKSDLSLSSDLLVETKTPP